MATSKKVYLHYEAGVSDYTLKLDITNETFDEMAEIFVQKYRSKTTVPAEKRGVSFENESGKTHDPTAKVSATVSDKEDIYVKILFRCSRLGCFESFREDENTEGSCLYHKGPATFHEGRQTWQCCGRKTYSFDDFEKIPGCVRGKHTWIQQVSGIKNKSIWDGKNMSSASPVSATIRKVVAKAKPKIKQVQIEDERELEDPEAAVIPVGTPCLRNGCNIVYEDASSYEKPCIYHWGVPLFHEGLKSWTCCKKRSADFTTCLALPGCTEGKCRFVKTTRELKKQSSVQCRYDFYQSNIRVTLNIYAKKVDKEKTVINITERCLEVAVAFQDGRVWNRKFDLYLEVVPEKSKFAVLSTKIEVLLSKKEGDNWEALEAEVM
mmetsp:Transcript_21080/g.23511  ORF Transcript_21080/g.23511 Transcript_21080/m.23511 type:complete len:379 (+) Transcript_21080:45-1181(+)